MYKITYNYVNDGGEKEIDLGETMYLNILDMRKRP